MTDDDQPRLAILGAGPIGLEATLYGRYLGYPAVLIERNNIPATGVLSLGNQTLGNFEELASTLGVGALRAQDTNWQPPSKLAVLTAAEWHQNYLVPFAQSDLVADVLHLSTEVANISRRDTEDDVSFEIRARDAQGAEVQFEADIIIDATGEEGSRTWFSDESSGEDLSFGNPDPDYYILGSKSVRAGEFRFSQGLEQIRELFAILGERDDLDVYRTMPPIA